MSLRGSTKSIEGLKYAGFNILSLANNHSLEHGYEALYDTMDLLNNNNIIPLGVGRKKEVARKPVVFNLKTKKIAVLGYCLRPDKTAYRSIKNKEEILEDIKNVKENVDYIILSLHWGDEFVQIPAPWQIDFAHKLIDNGASIILGHHPHVMQGIEEYNGGIIAYSLGNFVFDMWHEDEKIGGVLKTYLGEDIEYKFIKTHINNQFQPMPTKNADLPDIRKMKDEEYRKLVNYLHDSHTKDYKKFFTSHLFRYNKLIIPSLILNSLRYRSTSNE
jgi:poly-gamma-glutamate synthesis protein (capsule biosynthesis protein)